MKLGSASFVDAPADQIPADGSVVHVRLDGQYRGYFRVAGQFREGVVDMLTALKGSGKQLFLLSGDSEAARNALAQAEPIVMRAAQKGILHKNTASRKISRLTTRVKALAK